MTNLYLTNASADAAVTAGSGTKWKAGWAPGASSTHLNKNSVAGPTAPLQMTDGAAGTDGTEVSFYTEPLRAVTIAGAITCSMWTRENATANNVAPTIRIERCSGDGSVLSTIVAETTNLGAGEMGTTAGGATDTISVTAGNVTDTALSDGDRLRITLWIDDASGQGGTGSMASGGRGEFWVNGPNGAAGQSQLNFTDIVLPLDGPHLVAINEAAHNTTTTPKTTTQAAAVDGDRILVIAFGDGGLDSSNAVTACTTTITAGTTGAVTEKFEYLPSGGVDCWIHVAWVDVTGTGSVTTSTARTQSGTARNWGVFSMLFRAHGGFGVQATATPGGTADVISMAGLADKSIIVHVAPSWDATGVPTGFSPTGGTEIERAIEGTDYTVTAAYWVGQASGTRSYGTTLWADSDVLQYCLEILAPAGLTAVGDELALIWDTRAEVGDSIQAIWDVRAIFGESLELIWDIRTIIGDSIQALWDLRSIIGDEVALLWDVDGPVAKELSLVWDTRAIFGETLELIWGIRTMVGEDLSFIWDIRAALGDTIALAWDIRGIVGDTIQALWDVRATLGDVIALVWDVRSVVGDTASLIWDVRSLVGDDLALIWDVRSPVGDPVDLIWDIRAALGDTVELRWDVRGIFGEELVLLWDVDSEAILVSKDLALLWAIDGPVGKNLSLQWDVRAILGDALAVVWDVRAVLNDELTLLWDLRSALPANIGLIWDVRSVVGDPLQVSWSVLTAAGDDLTLIWAIDGPVGNELVLLWNIESDAPVSLYVLRGEVLERWRTGVSDRDNGVVRRHYTEVLERWRTAVRDENA